MDFRGVLPTDAPDPSIETEARALLLPFPVLQLVPQAALTRMPGAGFMETGDGALISVSFSFTLWRHPENHDDPRNEIGLDDRTRKAVDEEPPWGRPAWLIERAQLFRYPMLVEAIRTTWHASSDGYRSSLEEQLVDHTNHVLRNSFREELGLPTGPNRGDRGWEVSTRSVSDATATVDGREIRAVQIDTDPLVYAIGFRIDDQTVCTTAISRDALAHVELMHTTWE